jgi:hypothetical protein
MINPKAMKPIITKYLDIMIISGNDKSVFAVRILLPLLLLNLSMAIFFIGYIPHFNFGYWRSK